LPRPRELGGREHCERTITQALTPVEGVRAVRVDIPAKRVEVDYDDSAIDVNKMKDILQDEDYPVASVGA
jgi:copper chaperone